MVGFGHHRQLSSGSAVTEAAKHSLGEGPEPVPVVLPVVYSIPFLKKYALKKVGDRR